MEVTNEQNRQDNSGELIIPDISIDNQASDEKDNIQETPNLINANFTPQDAREELNLNAVEKKPVIIQEDVNNREKNSAIIWLVGILSFLAVGILVVWLVAK